MSNTLIYYSNPYLKSCIQLYIAQHTLQILNSITAKHLNTERDEQQKKKKLSDESWCLLLTAEASLRVQLPAVCLSYRKCFKCWQESCGMACGNREDEVRPERSAAETHTIRPH